MDGPQRRSARMPEGPLRMESLLWLDTDADGREAHWIARLHRGDGAPFCAEAHLHPVVARNGAAAHVVLVMTDVTSRIGSGKARERVPPRLRQALEAVRNRPDRSEPIQLGASAAWWRAARSAVSALPRSAAIWISLMHPATDRPAAACAATGSYSRG